MQLMSAFFLDIWSQAWFVWTCLRKLAHYVLIILFCSTITLFMICSGNRLMNAPLFTPLPVKKTGFLSAFQCVWKFRILCQVWLDWKEHGLRGKTHFCAYKRGGGSQQILTSLLCCNSHFSSERILGLFGSLVQKKMAFSQKNCGLLLVIMAAVCIQQHQCKYSHSF